MLYEGCFEKFLAPAVSCIFIYRFLTVISFSYNCFQHILLCLWSRSETGFLFVCFVCVFVFVCLFAFCFCPNFIVIYFKTLLGDHELEANCQTRTENCLSSLRTASAPCDHECVCVGGGGSTHITSAFIMLAQGVVDAA